MSDYNVSRSEMKRLTNITDSDLDAMRAGRVPHADPSMDALTRFVGDLGEAFPEPSTEQFEGAHVAAMLAAAHLMAENGELVARPASKADGPGLQASGLPKPWRETIMKKMFATRSAKVAAATLAMLLAFAGVAVAGVLPTPVQHKVADAAQTVGINLPGGADEVEADDVEQVDEIVVPADGTQVDETDANDVQQADENADAQDEQPAAKSNDQGADGDHQGAESDAQGDDNDDQGETHQTTVTKHKSSSNDDGESADQGDGSDDQEQDSVSQSHDSGEHDGDSSDSQSDGGDSND